MSRRGELDDIDIEIVRLLTANARCTNTAIAERVNLSPVPVKRRIDRLERLGVIRGYTVVLDQAKIGAALEAFSELRFAGNTKLEDILDAATRLPEVQEAFTIAGDPDALVRLVVKDVSDLQRVVNELRKIPSVTGTKTMIVLDRRSSSTG